MPFHASTVILMSKMPISPTRFLYTRYISFESIHPEWILRGMLAPIVQTVET